MGKSKRSVSKGQKKGKKAPVYGSDDERAYGKEEVPDKQSHDFYYDEIDEFHAGREKILLDNGAAMEPADFSSEEDEVMGIDSDESDNQLAGEEEDMDSDLEEKQDDDLPNEKAWGSKKSKYYGADIQEDRDVWLDEETEEATADLEEKEALALQKKMAEQLDEEDFGLEIFKSFTKPKEKEQPEEKIVKDLSKLSKREKLELLKKDSPELLELIEDFQTKMVDVRDKFLPLLKLVRNETIASKSARTYIETKVKLYLNYCVNISFYMMLKAKHTPVHNHPVIGRLVQYRNLIKQLEPVDDQIKPDLENLLEKIKNGEVIKPVHTVKSDVKKSKPANDTMKKERNRQQKQMSKKKKLSELISSSDEEEEKDEMAPSGGRSRKKKKLDDASYETKDEVEALEYYEMMKGGRRQGDDDDVDDDDDFAAGAEDEGEEMLDEDMLEGEDEEMNGKRGITYQIEKNKGLTPKRKKEYRNPRVKHKLKYRKAKIRRKGQIREARKELHRYGGEISGIRAGIKRGVKLK